MNADHLAALTHPLAATVTDDTPWIGPGMMGFLIVVVIGVATWLLVRSMAKQLRKLDPGTPEQDEAQPQDAREPAAPVQDAEPRGAH